MNKRRDLLVLLFFLLLIFFFFYLGFQLLTPQSSLDSLSFKGGDKVGLIKIVGPIYNSEPILEQLDKLEKNSSVKAILVRLETPGGGVAAAQEIYSRLVYLRDEKGLPVVVSMGGVAASGGYYIALGADTIMANPGTTTGSIGVIAEFATYGQLLNKIGVEVEVVKSGKFKDTGSPHRTLTPEERDYLQSVIDDTYQQFVEAVAQERNLDLEQVKQVADGRIFTGRQAQELGLIDLLGGMDEALNVAGKMAGLSGTPNIVEVQRKKLTLFDIMFGDLEEILFLRLGLTMPLKYELPRNLP